ncbi:MAG: hypothetical protein K5873_06295 [Treponema sp.]|nr:hypothetical protein [Treponema sp.]
MKKTIIKTVAVTTIFIALGSASLFASGMNRNKGNGRMGWNNNEECPCQDFDFRGPNGRMGGEGMMGPGPMGMNKADLVGTVSAVSPDKKTVSVKDADGKERKIHVNPMTRLHQVQPGSASPAKADATPAERRALRGPKDNSLLLADVKVGDFVMVMKLGGETETIEAGRIAVAREEAAD